MGAINSSVNIPSIPTSLKKAKNTSDSRSVTVYSFDGSCNKQTIQKKKRVEHLLAVRYKVARSQGETLRKDQQVLEILWGDARP